MCHVWHDSFYHLDTSLLFPPIDSSTGNTFVRCRRPICSAIKPSTAASLTVVFGTRSQHIAKRMFGQRNEIRHFGKRASGAQLYNKSRQRNVRDRWWGYPIGTVVDRITLIVHPLPRLPSLVCEVMNHIAIRESANKYTFRPAN